MRFLALLPFVALVAWGCDPDAGAGPDVEPADPARGAVAFRDACASCHASRDGFDLAFFGFPAADIVRRGVDHVDSASARDIAAHVAALGVEAVGRDFRAFQPTGVVGAGGDDGFWRSVMGGDGVPDDLTPEALRSIDLRDLPVPLPFPVWSSETSEGDWMPETPLPPALLTQQDGMLRSALERYHAGGTEEALVEAVAAFQTVTRGYDDDALCSGIASLHPRWRECFEARRWMSSLTALHFLRSGRLRDVPFEVAELWWDTGEVAVTAFFEGDRFVDRETVAAWLYLASVFVPDGFPGPGIGIAEDAGYMGQFLQGDGYPRMATFISLRRMVDTGPLHDRPLQAYWDGTLAVTRAPSDMAGDVLAFVLDYLEAELEAGRRPSGDDATQAWLMLRGARNSYLQRGGSGDPERDEALSARIDAVNEALVGPNRTGAAPPPHGSGRPGPSWRSGESARPPVLLRMSSRRATPLHRRVSPTPTS